MITGHATAATDQPDGSDSGTMLIMVAVASPMSMANRLQAGSQAVFGLLAIGKPRVSWTPGRVRSAL